MIIEATPTIAFKCPSCGSFEFSGVSLFKLMQNKVSSISCHCGNSYAELTVGRSGIYSIRMGCIGCGDEHIFALDRKDLLGKSLNGFGCPVTGVQLCFFGSDSEVRMRVDHLEKEQDELMGMLGYDRYFRNTQVMFDSLNRIHDIAEQGNLSCECGHRDVDLKLFPDRIHLQCRKCLSSKVIYAASNEDFKHVQAVQQILIQESPGFTGGQFKRNLRKYDGK